MLEYDSSHFETVELNNTFYRLPTGSGLENWRTTTPSRFCFAVKGSRFLTHMKKLKDPEVGIGRFFERADGLRPKLGPIVFQLPPFWEIDTARLEHFLRALPSRHRYAFEFRNPTWHTEPVYRILREHNAAFCIFEIAGFASAHTITADFTYVRLHGPEGAYQGSYSGSALRQWAGRIAQWQNELRAVYVYFDNDQAGYAVKNAQSLKRLVGGLSRLKEDRSNVLAETLDLACVVSKKCVPPRGVRQLEIFQTPEVMNVQAADHKRIIARFRGAYSKSIRAITNCGIMLFQSSGRLSNGRRKGLVAPGSRPPAFFATIGTRCRKTTCPYGS